MTTQAVAGQFGASAGIFVTKPGYDVFSALPGQFLIDSNSTIYQLVAQGLTELPSGGAGQRSAFLGGAFTPYSDLFVWGFWYLTNPDGSNPRQLTNIGSFISIRVIGGTLYINFNLTSIAGRYFVRWVVFRNSL